MAASGEKIFSSFKVGPVVVDMLDPLPHLPAVAAAQLVLDPPPVVRLDPLDTPLRASTSHAVESCITRLESSAPLL